MSDETPRDSGPSRPGARLSLFEARERGGGPVAGRYLRGRSRDLLQDESAVLELSPGTERPGHGDQVAGVLSPGDGGLVLHEVRVLTPSRRELPPELQQLAAMRPNLEARSRILAEVRALFSEDGFLEVETPSRVINPGLEPHLRPFPAGDERWLITSPELHLKRFLAAGYERIFEIARSFRDDEAGPHHASEFAMLEWYRAHAGLDDLAADCCLILRRCAIAAGRDPATAVEGCDLSLEPERLSVAEAFDREGLGDPHAMPPDDRELAFVERVEPRLGRGRPTLLDDWPADAAALATLREDGRGRTVAARLELYVAGVELANGFDELVDAGEQRRRHEADRETRLAAGQPAPPLDEGFLAALEAGLPPSAGMALGLDRLVLVLLGESDLARVRAFAGGR